MKLKKRVKKLQTEMEVINREFAAWKKSAVRIFDELVKEQEKTRSLEHKIWELENKT